MNNIEHFSDKAYRIIIYIYIIYIYNIYIYIHIYIYINKEKKLRNNKGNDGGKVSFI